MLYYIAKAAFESVDKSIQKLIKKCQKNGVDYIYNVKPEEVKTMLIHFDDNLPPNGLPRVKKALLVVIPIELEIHFRLNGWTFIGCTKNLDGTKQAYYQNFDDAKKYLSLDMTRCDHCHIHRQRKSVSVLEHEDGRRIIVGTTCVKEFTCGLDGEFCAKWLQVINDEVQAYACNCDECSHDFYDRVTGGYSHYSTDYIVSAATSMVEKYGFISREKAKWNPDVVSSCTRFHAFLDDLEKGNEVVTDANEAFAKSAIDWCKSLTDDQIKNSVYLLNLREACKSELCLFSQFGMLVSLIPTYKHAIEKEHEKQKITPSEHVGNVGDKLKLEVTFISDTTIDTQFGVMHILRFYYGTNVIIWKTNKGIKKDCGETVCLTGTVKAHDEYKNVKQTILTRCKVA